MVLRGRARKLNSITIWTSLLADNTLGKSLVLHAGISWYSAGRHYPIGGLDNRRFDKIPPVEVDKWENALHLPPMMLPLARFFLAKGRRYLVPVSNSFWGPNFDFRVGRNLKRKQKNSLSVSCPNKRFRFLIQSSCLRLPMLNIAISLILLCRRHAAAQARPHQALTLSSDTNGTCSQDAMHKNLCL